VTTLTVRDCVGGGGELVDDFEQRVLAIAAAAAPNTRRAYATAYRAFIAFLRARYGEASPETVTISAVAAWRDQLAAQGLAPSTIALRVSAVRGLAVAIGGDPLVHQVRCTQVQQQRPKALSDVELARLLARPDLRSTIGSATTRSSDCSRAPDFAAQSSLV
jgi:site-specific recombinase XerD